MVLKMDILKVYIYTNILKQIAMKKSMDKPKKI